MRLSYYDTTMCHELLLVYYIPPEARGKVLGYANLRVPTSATLYPAGLPRLRYPTCAYHLATCLSSRHVAALLSCLLSLLSPVTAVTRTLTE